jgi:hypothetical protein
MGLPSSGQISINDIATEFNVSLSNVALNATLGTYASKASGATTAMSDFYGLSNLTAFAYNSEGQEGGPGDACSLESIEETAYHNGSGTYPVEGDAVYSDSGGTTALGGATYKYGNGSESGGFIVVEGGEVVKLGSCE